MQHKVVGSGNKFANLGKETMQPIGTIRQLSNSEEMKKIFVTLPIGGITSLKAAFIFGGTLFRMECHRKGQHVGNCYYIESKIRCGKIGEVTKWKITGPGDKLKLENDK